MTKLRSSRRRTQRKQPSPGLHLPPSLPPSLWKTLPPLLSLTSSSSPHSVSSASSSHTSLCPREQRPAYAPTHTQTQTLMCACTAAPRKRDKELATPKGPASVTLLPRLDHMASGAERSERTQRGGVGTRVGGEKAQEQKKKKGNVIKMQKKKKR